MRRCSIVLLLSWVGIAGCYKEEKLEARWALPSAVVTPEAPLGYISNNGSDSVSVVDLTNMTELVRVPVGLDPVTPEAPHHLTIDPVTGALFVGLSNVGVNAGGGLHGSHGTGSVPSYVEKLGLFNFSMQGEVRVDTNLGDIVITPDRTRIVTTHFDLARALSAASSGLPAESGYSHLVVVDAITMERIVAITTCTAPHGVAILSDARTALVACYGDDAVAFVDLTNEQVTARVAVGPAPGDVSAIRYGPYTVSVAPDEALAAVGTLESKTLRVLDVAGHEMIDDRAVTLDGAVYFGAFNSDGTKFWAPTQARDAVVRINFEDGSIESTHTFSGDECVAPHEVTWRADLNKIFVICEGDHITSGSLVEMDPETLAVQRSVELGVYPDGMRVVEAVTP